MRLAWGEGEAWRESAGGAAGDLREVCGTEVRGVPYGDGGAGGARCRVPYVPYGRPRDTIVCVGRCG